MCASLWITRHPLCFYEGSQSAKRHNHFHYLRTKPPPTYTYPILTGSSHHSLVRRPRESEWDVTGSLTERNRGLACQTVFPAPSSPPTHIHCAVLKNGIWFPSHRNQLKAVFAVAVASSTSAAATSWHTAPTSDDDDAPQNITLPRVETKVSSEKKNSVPL